MRQFEHLYSRSGVKFDRASSLGKVTWGGLAGSSFDRDGWFQTLRSLLTRPTSTHSTTKILPS